MLSAVTVLLYVLAVCSADQCPDGTYCDQLTCCQYDHQHDVYACCPFSNGICCVDGLHCCPDGYFCDQIQAECVRDYRRNSSGLIDAVTARPPLRAALSSNHLHQDSEVTTPALSSNRLHQDSAVTRPALLAALGGALFTNSSSAVPLDAKCKDGTNCNYGTCCQLAAGDWACCPQTDAVCCDDHIHCCPQGTTCDTVHRGCIKD